jgi:signal transduction histidine kinase
MRVALRLPLRIALLLAALLWSGALACGQAPDVLTVAQIRALPAEDFAARRTVRVHGVVTYSAPEAFLFFVQDDTGGIYAAHPPIGAIAPGTRVEVEGRLHPGRFAARLDALDPSGAVRGTKVSVLGPGELPPPHQLASRDLGSSAQLYRRVEVTGVLRSVAPERRRKLTLHVTSAAGPLDVVMRSADFGADFPPANWVGGLVRIRGVATAKFDGDRGLAGVEILVPRPVDIELTHGGVDTFLEIPRRTANTLRQFSAEAGPRARVRGTVTLHETGRGLFLRDETASIWVHTPQTEIIHPGTVVDAVGFPIVDGARATLEDAVCVSREVLPPAPPRDIDIHSALTGAHYGELVRVNGYVVDRFFSPGNNSVALQSGDVMFDARLVRDPDNDEVRLPSRGALVSVSGVCVNRPGGSTSSEVGQRGYQPVALQLLMRSMDDMRVLRAPSWWTTERVATLLAWVSVALLVAVIVAAYLARRTRIQAGVIRENRAREAVHEDRQRIARELHDTLEQELTGISLTLDAASDTLADSPGAASAALERARQLLRHTRTEARRSIWDLRALALERGDFVSALREIAAQFPSPPEVIVSTEGEPRRLNALLENNLLRIATEAVTNAVKHSGASTVSVLVRFEPAGVQLVVRDNGRGFDPAQTSSNGTHFGLLGMRERAHQSAAQLKVMSEPSSGTQIIVQAPIPS